MKLRKGYDEIPLFMDYSGHSTSYQSCSDHFRLDPNPFSSLLLIYQLQLSFFTANPCHLFLPQAFYIITHTLISYSNHMQVVMVVERIVATVWVDTYEKQCRALGAVLLAILLLLTALETVGSIGDNFADVLMTNSLMVTDSTASDVTAAFAVIFVVCCVTLLINILQYCFNLHRKKR
ncbi:hypothetical protein TELCIR_23691, partial [Teladorsagia circumcincta]